MNVGGEANPTPSIHHILSPEQAVTFTVLGEIILHGEMLESHHICVITLVSSSGMCRHRKSRASALRVIISTMPSRPRHPLTVIITPVKTCHPAISVISVSSTSQFLQPVQLSQQDDPMGWIRIKTVHVADGRYQPACIPAYPMSKSAKQGPVMTRDHGGI